MCLFWLGQIGIIFEIFGAGYIVYAALKTKKKLENKSHDIDAADVIQSTLTELKGQYKNEVIGFSVLVLGLIMQFIGGFSK